MSEPFLLCREGNLHGCLRPFTYAQPSPRAAHDGRPRSASEGAVSAPALPPPLSFTPPGLNVLLTMGLKLSVSVSLKAELQSTGFRSAIFLSLCLSFNLLSISRFFKLPSPACLFPTTFQPSSPASRSPWLVPSQARHGLRQPAAHAAPRPGPCLRGGRDSPGH